MRLYDPFLSLVDHARSFGLGVKSHLRAYIRVIVVIWQTLIDRWFWITNHGFPTIA